MENASNVSNRNGDDDGIDINYQLQNSPVSSNEKEDDASLSLTEVLYAFSSYHAIVKPVTLTMILSALAVIFLNTEETLRTGEEELTSFYLVWKQSENGGNSTGENLARSIVNTFVIVSVICLMTFGIVLLYKYRCMNCLLGYMIFSSSTLLAVLGGTMFNVAIEKYHIPIDKLSFYFLLYNFAIVGTTSIFYQKGIPTYVTQGYLVATSVMLAYQLSRFDEWTSWTLLIMLAFYDLCAVLTPCGPLKALVGLMQQEGSPEMPGLLYEAELPPQVQRPSSRNNTASQPNNVNYSEPDRDSIPSNSDYPSSSYPSNSNYSEPVLDPNQNRIVILPLAIARIYRLPILNDSSSPNDGSSGNLPLIQNNYTLDQLRSEVQAVLPDNGARIETKIGSDGTPRYLVFDRHNNLKRTLLIDSQARVYEELDDDDHSTDAKGSNSIKLGLGDFIFFSVLVSKAAMYSFTTFISCMLVILAGLGLTLVLLSVYHQALPALPISIFLGVIFYLLTRNVIEPWIEDILRAPYYL